MISIKELDFFQDKIGEWYYTLNDVPYTGGCYGSFPDGTRSSENNFLNGYKEGIQREWYKNGQLESEYFMTNNVYNGPSKAWYENGVLKYDAEWKNGEEISYRRYSENGVLTKSS